MHLLGLLMDIYTYQYLVTAKAESGPCSGERDIETWSKNMTSFCRHLKIHLLCNSIQIYYQVRTATRTCTLHYHAGHNSYQDRHFNHHGGQDNYQDRQFTLLGQYRNYKDTHFTLSGQDSSSKSTGHNFLGTTYSRPRE